MLAYQAGRSTRRSSGPAGASAGSSGSRTCRSFRRCGWRISATTTIGSTARSARTLRDRLPGSRGRRLGGRYTNAVPRLLEGLKVPRLGIIGPWGHIYPQDGVPGPAIGFLQEAVRWWDHWLKGRDTGIMKEPMLRAYIEDPVPPTARGPSRPGAGWASARILARGQAAAAAPARRPRPRGGAGASTDFAIRSPQSHGKAAGEWMGVGCPGEHPTDQRLDDGGALVFETLLWGGIDVGCPRLRLPWPPMRRWRNWRCASRMSRRTGARRASAIRC